MPASNGAAENDEEAGKKAAAAATMNRPTPVCFSVLCGFIATSLLLAAIILISLVDTDVCWNSLKILLKNDSFNYNRYYLKEHFLTQMKTIFE